MSKQVPCPICRQPALFEETNQYRPFCSHRCQLIDLGEWFNEERKIAGEPADPDEAHGENSHVQ